MNKLFLIFAGLAIVVFGYLATGTATAAESGGMSAAPGCQYCGMNLDKHAHAAVDITYDDGGVTKLCSLHCAAVDLALKIDKIPVKIEVGDYKSKAKINAEEAFWVMDSKNPGVMTARAKWAFADKAAAEQQIAEKGGQLISFEEAISAAYTDMYNDTKMIRERRKMKRSQGQM